MQIRNNELTIKIKQGEDGTKYQQELERKINNLKNMHLTFENGQTNCLKKFANDLPKICYKSLIPKVIKMLSSTEIADKNIPNVNNKTIEFLLKRGECMCSQKLEIGGDYHATLVKLLDYVPPKYIGAAVSEYIAVSKSRISPENMSDLVTDFDNYKMLQRELQSRIDDEESEIQKLKDKLKTHKDTAKYAIERTDNEETIRRISYKMCPDPV